MDTDCITHQAALLVERIYLRVICTRNGNVNWHHCTVAFNAYCDINLTKRSKMATKSRISPEYYLELSLNNSSDARKYDETIVNAQKHGMGEQEIGSLAEKNIFTTSRVDEYRRMENTNVATEDARETVKSSTPEIPWLASLIVFCTEVSVVGLRHVVNLSASATRRSIWLLLVFAGAVFTTYHIQDRIVYYYTHPVNVVIRDEHIEEMRFPTVTICSENRVSLSKAESIGECWNHNFSSR